MKLTEIVLHAKSAQNKLKNLSCPADHIYVLDSNKSSPIIVFISENYNAVDLYYRTSLATRIHSGPFNLKFYVLGTNHILNANSLITRAELYQAVKIYGKNPLIFENNEFASISDTQFINDGVSLNARNTI